MIKQDDQISIAGGLLDRRVFLKKGQVFSVATLSSEPLLATIGDARSPWMKTPGARFSNYGQPSVYEQDVIRWTMDNT